ncbi:colorectal mutant cancer protein-like isoform X1 [Hemiscyllium ocellatum]|uniref:colorectal mutant cancer protein-like isoform X1 n=1 Tax=Hemiscyllium ocellatum TaxID=170820 RepID=UPI0029662F42|nr:colorectal mutant cancer protein-like isoform X1 [Hemiscyllium ocellatum]
MEGPDCLLDVKTETPPEEEALTVLHYEEQITELLVVIAELNRKIDRLTVSTIREEDEYLDTFSDISDSLYFENNTCLHPDPSQPTVSNCPGQPCQLPGSAGEPGELPQKLQQVLTELEETVRICRTEIPLCCADPGEEEQSALAHWSLVTQTIEEVEQELGVDLSPELQEERSQREAELDCLREKNQHLSDQLVQKDQELWRVSSALAGIQQDRDKLQLKADDLLSCLQSLQQNVTTSPPPSPFPSIMDTGTTGCSTINTELQALGNNDPGLMVERLIQSFQDCSGIQDIFQFLCRYGSNVSRVRIQDSGREADQLRNCIDEWKSRNEQLSRVLKECKGDCEWLSMLLGRLESNDTALRLALQYSEECVDVYGLLLAEVQTKGSSLETEISEAQANRCVDRGGRFGRKDMEGLLGEGGGEAAEDVHSIDLPNTDHHHQGPTEYTQRSLAGELEGDNTTNHLRGDIVRLRGSHAAVMRTVLEVGDIPAHLKRYGEGMSQSWESGAAVRGLLVPGISAQSPRTVRQHKMEKKEVLQELLTVRDEMAWLKGQLGWVKREKRDLEQRLRLQKSQEEAAILLLAHWQAERDDCLQQQPTPVCSKEETAPEPDVLTMASDQLESELTAVSTRQNELRERAEVLVTSLEKLLRSNHTQKVQSEELASELRKTYSNMSTAYRNAKRKYENQLRKLESQASTMCERQATQTQALEEKVTCLRKVLEHANGTPL